MTTDTTLADRVAALERRMDRVEAGGRPLSKPPSTFSFPEAGPGRRFSLDMLSKAFQIAQIELGARDLRRSTDRVRLQNRRMAGAMADIVGTRIANGKQGPNSYAVFFDPAVIRRAIQHLDIATQGKSP